MIAMQELVKKFPHKNKAGKETLKTAVDGISLDVRKGEVFGLLGPNGAGKTTIIRMLTMQTKPTSGTIRIAGKDIREAELELKRIIGVVPQHINFDFELDVGRNLELHARLHHIPKDAARERIDKLLSEMSLTEVVKDNVKRLSGGMSRRLLIARALIHEPRILFMDEPTVALDPQIRRRIWDFIREVSGRGVTVFLTTHYIEEAEALCDRVAIINHGKLIEVKSPHEFCEELGSFAVEWDGADGRDYRFFQSEAEAEEFLEELVRSNVRALRRQTNLEDVFIELTGRKEGLDAK